MNGLTVACVFAAWTVTALTVAGVWARRGVRVGSGRDRLMCEAHERAEAAREIDELELLYDLPAYDPAWDAGRERLWDAIRDNHTTTEGDT